MGAASQPTKRHLMAMRPVALAVSGRTEARRIEFVQLLTLFKLHAGVVVKKGSYTGPRMGGGRWRIRWSPHHTAL